jgi:hypothetical protein
MQQSATLDLSVADVTGSEWKDLVRSMTGYEPDSDPTPPTCSCGEVGVCDEGGHQCST